MSNNSVELKLLKHTHYLRGKTPMTNNEIELANIILQSDDPERTIRNALEIIFSLSQQHGASQEPFAGLTQECCRTFQTTVGA